MSFEAAWDIAQNIPGWYLEEEARVLYDSACKSYTGVGFLEVGCYAGRSTRVIAEAAKETNSHLWIIDRFQHEHPLPGVDDPKAMVLQMLAASGCEYTLIHSSVRDLDYKDKPYFVDFVHIDDSHKYSDLEIDRQNILPRLRHRGIVCFHDYIPDWPDVVRFVDSLREEYTEINRAGGCIALEKK